MGPGSSAGEHGFGLEAIGEGRHAGRFLVVPRLLAQEEIPGRGELSASEDAFGAAAQVFEFAFGGGLGPQSLTHLIGTPEGAADGECE